VSERGRQSFTSTSTTVTFNRVCAAFSAAESFFGVRLVGSVYSMLNPPPAVAVPLSLVSMSCGVVWWQW
jgi:hypothetical protein